MPGIGRGARRPAEISGRLGVQSTSLAKPLRHLVQLGLVRRDAPYDFARGRPAEATRSSLYALADPFPAMWYRCVYPYWSGLEVCAPAAQEHAWEAWDHHVAAVWEDLVRRHWHWLALDGLEWEAAGRYWEGRRDRGLEWDAAAVTRDRRRAMLGECKWPRQVTSRDLRRLVREVRSRPRPVTVRDKLVQEILFLPSRAGLPEEVGGVRLVEAADLLRASRAT